MFEIHNMDCVAAMRSLPDNSVDSIVTDPPYELGFMGKGWDSTGIANSVEMWREALRVLKPGGHLLAFSGSRTYHRMTCAIEDAGFEVRDQIMWVYGSGFPKSLDVAKALEAQIIKGRSDSQATGDGRSRVPGQHYKEFRKASGPKADFNPTTDAARQWEGWGTALKPAHEPICVARKPLIGTVAQNVLEWGTGAININGCRVQNESCGTGRIGEADSGRPGRNDVRDMQKANDEMGLAGSAGQAPDDLQRGVSVSVNDRSGQPPLGERGVGGHARGLPLPADGFTESTGQGPAIEPEGAASSGAPLGRSASDRSTATGNGNGAPHQRGEGRQSPRESALDELGGPLQGTPVARTRSDGTARGSAAIDGSLGRWPANLIHDGSDEVVALFPGQAGAAAPVFGTEASAASTGNVTGERARVAGAFHADNGSAARFFYCAKTSKADRNAGTDQLPQKQGGMVSNTSGQHMTRRDEGYQAPLTGNNHPTVKPTDLMAYLVRLVTPPGGLVLDPFMGSGSTGKACMREGMRFIGCELSAEYVTIAEARIVHELSGGLL